MHLVKRFDFGDNTARYELICLMTTGTTPLICRECRTVVEIEECFDSELESKIAKKHGFKNVTHQLGSDFAQAAKTKTILSSSPTTTNPFINLQRVSSLFSILLLLTNSSDSPTFARVFPMKNIAFCLSYFACDPKLPSSEVLFDGKNLNHFEFEKEDGRSKRMARWSAVCRSRGTRKAKCACAAWAIFGQRILRL